MPEDFGVQTGRYRLLKRVVISIATYRVLGLSIEPTLFIILLEQFQLFTFLTLNTSAVTVTTVAFSLSAILALFQSFGCLAIESLHLDRGCGLIVYFIVRGVMVLLNEAHSIVRISLSLSSALTFFLIGCLDPILHCLTACL